MGHHQAVLRMIVRLPFPDKSLMPNRKNGRHWTTTQAIKTAQHDAAFYATRQAMQGWMPPNGNMALSLLYLTPDKRHRDCDNMLAASKPMIDGIAKALGVDDSRFKPILVDWLSGPKGGALIAAIGVEIRSGMNLQEVS